MLKYEEMTNKVWSKRVTITIPEWLLGELKRYAERRFGESRSMSLVIREAIVEYLKKRAE